MRPGLPPGDKAGVSSGYRVIAPGNHGQFATCARPVAERAGHRSLTQWPLFKVNVANDDFTPALIRCSLKGPPNQITKLGASAKAPFRQRRIIRSKINRVHRFPPQVSTNPSCSQPAECQSLSKSRACADAARNPLKDSLRLSASRRINVASAPWAR